MTEMEMLSSGTWSPRPQARPAATGKGEGPDPRSAGLDGQGKVRGIPSANIMDVA